MNESKVMKQTSNRKVGSARARRERVPLSPEMALDLLTSVLGECDLAGVHVGVQVIGGDVVLTVTNAPLLAGEGGVLIVPASMQAQV